VMINPEVYTIKIIERENEIESKRKRDIKKRYIGVDGKGK